nr:unnamed protein product [Callosobruchus chinensis]
MQSRER